MLVNLFIKNKKKGLYDSFFLLEMYVKSDIKKIIYLISR
jgi:hypothetical protein